jgi:hypothetical protein
MPKVKLTPIKQKTKNEEVKEIITNPNDPLAKYPLRAFGYSNEFGAAVSAMPGWGKIAEAALWVPALMYLGADIYDKYRRGKEGDYTKASASAAVEQAVFQALASVVLPTAAVKMGQGIAGNFAKYDGTNLTANVKEELWEKLQDDFSKAKFTKGDRTDASGVFKTGKELVWERIHDQGFLHDLDATKENLKKRSLFKRVIDFFGHPSGMNATSKCNKADIERFLKEKVFSIYDRQILVETGTFEDIVATGNKKFIKAYQKALAKVEKTYKSLIEERPNFVVEKILSSGEAKYKNLVESISKDFSSIDAQKLLVAATDKGREASGKLLAKLMKDETNKELIFNIAKKAELSNEVIMDLIQSKKLKMGILKTTGGFIALGLLAVPIDHFVHKYIIKSFLEPSIDNVKKMHSKMSFKRNSKEN